MEKLKLTYEILDDNDIVPKNYVLNEKSTSYCGKQILSIRRGKYEEKHRYIKRNPVFILDGNKKDHRN